MHGYPTAFEQANREVIFVHSADLDDNDVPDIESDGTLLWSAQEISYALLPSINGRNQIERRIDGQLDRVIARHVESMTFDDEITSGGEVPQGCLRLTLGMAMDANGQIYRRQVQRALHLVQEVD